MGSKIVILLVRLTSVVWAQKSSDVTHPSFTQFIEHDLNPKKCVLVPKSGLRER